MDKMSPSRYNNCSYVSRDRCALTLSQAFCMAGDQRSLEATAGLVSSPPHHWRSSPNLSREQTGASVGPPSAPGVSRPPVKDNDALGRRRPSPDKALPVAFSNSVRYVAANGGVTAAIVALLAVFHNASQL